MTDEWQFEVSDDPLFDKVFFDLDSYNMGYTDGYDSGYEAGVEQSPAISFPPLSESQLKEYSD